MMRGRKNTKFALLADSRCISQSAGASLNTIGGVPSACGNKNAVSALSGDINDAQKTKNNNNGSTRANSAPARKRRWWFRKVDSESFHTSCHTLLYDRLVSRRLVSAIAAWHDIHSNLLQLSLSKRRQASRTRKKLDAERKAREVANKENSGSSAGMTASPTGGKHTCERQNHNHHYHYHGKNHQASQKTQLYDVDVKSNVSVSPTSLTSNLIAINCRHHCHRHHSQRKSKRESDRRFVMDEKEDRDGEEVRCGSLCGMNSICCSSVCSSLSCLSASPPTTLSRSSSRCSLSTASSMSSPTHTSSHDYGGSRPVSAVGDTFNSSSASANSLRFFTMTSTKIHCQGIVETDDIITTHITTDNGTTSAAENSTQSGNCLQPPIMQHKRHALDSFDNYGGDNKVVHEFNRSTPCTPSMQSLESSVSVGSVSAVLARRYFMRTKNNPISPRMKKLFHNNAKSHFDDFSDAETSAMLSDENETVIVAHQKRSLNATNHSDDDEVIVENSVVNNADSENGGDDDNHDDYGDENLMSDSTLDEIFESERKKFNRLSSPELTAIELKQMFPDLSDHWR